MARWPRSTRAILEYGILAGSSLSRTKTLGRVAALSALSLPRGHQVQPSASCWGSPGATPGRGWFDSRMHRPTMSSVTEALRGYAWHIEPSTFIPSRASCAHHGITMRALSSTSLTVFLGSLGAQAAFDKCQFRARHFGGVFISPYKPTPQLCTRSRMLSWLPYVSKLSRGHEACNVMIICVAIGLNHVIS